MAGRPVAMMAEAMPPSSVGCRALCLRTLFCLVGCAVLTATAPGQGASARVAALRALAASSGSPADCTTAALGLGDRALEVRVAAVDVLLTMRKDLEPRRKQLVELVHHRVSLPGQDRGFECLDRQLLINLQPIDAAALQSDDAAVRKQTVISLALLGPPAADSIPDLLDLLQRDPAADVRAAVARNISRIAFRVDIRNAVIAALDDAVVEVRRGAADGLRRMIPCEEIVDGWRSVIQDPDADVRATALRGLGHAGEFGKVAENEILSSTRDGLPTVRIAALEAVRARRMRGPRAAAATARCLLDRDRQVRLAALCALEAQGTAAARALPGVLAITRVGSSAEVRQAVQTAWRLAAPQGNGAVVLRSVELLGDTGARSASMAGLCGWVLRNREGTPDVRKPGQVPAGRGSRPRDRR